MARESYFSAGTAPLERFARGVYDALPKSLEEANEMFNPVEILQDAGSKSRRFVESGGRDYQAGIGALTDTATLGVGPAAYGVASLFRTPLKKGADFATKAFQEAFLPLGASDDRVEELGSELLTKGGKPLRLFHGTIRDFEEFDPEFKVKTATGRDFQGSSLENRGAHYFTPDPESASTFAKSGIDPRTGEPFKSRDPDTGEFMTGAVKGARVIPVYLKDANYFDVDNPDHFKIFKQSSFYKENKERLNEKFKFLNADIDTLIKSGEELILEEITPELKKLGFDGHTTYLDGNKNYAVYDTDLIVPGIEKKVDDRAVDTGTKDLSRRDFLRGTAATAALAGAPILKEVGDLLPTGKIAKATPVKSLLEGSASLYKQLEELGTQIKNAEVAKSTGDNFDDLFKAVESNTKVKILEGEQLNAAKKMNDLLSQFTEGLTKKDLMALSDADLIALNKIKHYNPVSSSVGAKAGDPLRKQYKKTADGETVVVNAEIDELIDEVLKERDLYDPLFMLFDEFAEGGLATLDHEARNMFRKPRGIASLTV